MTYPFPVGKLRANALNAKLRELTPLIARMISDQGLTASNTVLEDLTELVVAVEADTVYDGLLVIAWTLATGTTWPPKSTAP